MANSIQSIPLDKLIGHPDNPNRMSKGNFARLVGNIERSGRYEPLVVRPHPTEKDCYQIINGHHRQRALKQLGYNKAECVVWELDDEQSDILLATLNRLGGSDELGKKLKLLRRLRRSFESVELTKLLPQTKKQIEQLTSMKLPSIPAESRAKGFASAMVFFLSDSQKRTVEQALLLAEENNKEKRRAAKRAAALTKIARHFINEAGEV